MNEPSIDRRRGPKPSPELREAILRAAAILFAEQGIAATTTRQVAAAAGTTERTLFKHFGSKDALAQTLIQELSIKAMRSQSFARITEPTPFTPAEFRAWHREFLDERIAGATLAPDDYRILFRELFGNRKLAERYVAAWREQVLAPLARHLALMIESKAIGPRHSALALAGAFFSLSLSYLVARFAVPSGSDWISGDDAGAIVDLFATLCGWDGGPAGES